MSEENFRPRIPKADVNFSVPLVSISIGTQIGIILKAITVAVVGWDMFDLRYLNLQIQAGFDLEAGKNVPQRLVIFQLDVAQRKAHQMLAVHRHFEVRLGEGDGELKRLIENEGKSLRMDLGVTPACT